MTEITHYGNAIWAELQTHMVPGVAESFAEVDLLQLGCVLVLCLLGTRAVTGQ